MMTRTKRFCIFCGGPGLTKEHIWADWASRFVPKMVPFHTKLTLEIQMPGIADNSVSNFKKVDGDPRSRKVRRVCKNVCNGGWMAKLQDRVKPIALPLILGREAILSASDQRLLGAWVGMAVMCSEYSDEDFAAIPQSDRDFLRNFMMLPSSWKVWIGNCPDGEKDPIWNHQSGAFPDDGVGVPEANPGHKDTLNTQMTAYTFGRLYILAISSTRPNIVRLWRNGLEGVGRLRQIIPIIDDKVTWPPLIAVSSLDIWNDMDGLRRLAIDMNRRNAAEQ